MWLLAGVLLGSGVSMGLLLARPERGPLPCAACGAGPGHGVRGHAGQTGQPRPPTVWRLLPGPVRDLPGVVAWRERELGRDVRQACERQMPELLDILALGLSAGLSFDASLELYCTRRPCELAGEAARALSWWQMGLGSRAEALEEMAARTGSASVASFSAQVGEALAFGAPLAASLERQASALREEQRAQIQERVEEVPVRMLVPLGTLVVPAMLLAILGPLLAGAGSAG